MNDSQEKRLRDALHKLGRDGERRAPAFRRLWRKACEAQNARAAAAPRAPLKWAFATALVVIGGFVAVMMTPRRDPNANVTSHDDHAPQTAPMTADAFNQEAPTDFLLVENHETAAPPIEQLTHEIDALLRP